MKIYVRSSKVESTALSKFDPIRKMLGEDEWYKIEEYLVNGEGKHGLKDILYDEEAWEDYSNWKMNKYHQKAFAASKRIAARAYIKADTEDSSELLGYGIDYRDMHTAIHGIMWSPDKALIDNVEQICRALSAETITNDDYQDFCNELEGYFASNELFDEEEINFRNITKDNKYYLQDGYIQIVNPVSYDLYL